MSAEWREKMSTVTFDTLKFVERLERAGVPREQASAMAEAFKDASGEAELATKNDLDRLEIRLMGELNLVRWMLGAVLALAIANFAKQFL
jgi:hypothetical protein